MDIMSKILSLLYSFFYCCFINYHKFISLNQHPFISFCRAEVQHSVAGFSAQGFTRVKSSCQLVCVSVWKLWERINFQVILGRIQIFVVAGLRSLYSLWLSYWRLLMIPRSFLHSLPRDPIHLPKTAMENLPPVKSFSYFKSL